jgi:hypothetical protein
VLLKPEELYQLWITIFKKQILFPFSNYNPRPDFLPIHTYWIEKQKLGAIIKTDMEEISKNVKHCHSSNLLENVVVKYNM